MIYSVFSILKHLQPSVVQPISAQLDTQIRSKETLRERYPSVLVFPKEEKIMLLISASKGKAQFTG